MRCMACGRVHQMRAIASAGALPLGSAASPFPAVRVVQVKKPEIRQAILDSAFGLFSTKGYVETTLPQISAQAGISTTNLYSYFDSKLEILYAIHGPWMRTQLDALEVELDGAPSPRERLRLLFTALYRDIPARERGFANNVMQAIATARPEDSYRSTLIDWLEDRILEMIRGSLPPARRRLLDNRGVVHFLTMAFDGYIVFHHVAPQAGCSDETIDFLCDLFLGRAKGSGVPAA
ncbi:MAG: TetR/AcrR family transcriptional regulator [Rhizobacter sp.]|nr:TetR/AcrR family transcriptional regulator [Rhizobacter sp.]